MRFVFVFLAAAALAGCKSEAEVKAEWMQFCIQGEFSQKQCEVLYSMKKSSDDAQDSAAASSMMSGMALGMSAGVVGRR